MACNFIIILPPGEECEGNAIGYVCPSVCLSVCLSVRTCNSKTIAPISRLDFCAQEL